MVGNGNLSSVFLSLLLLARRMEAEIRLLFCKITARSLPSQKCCWINLRVFNSDE